MKINPVLWILLVVGVGLAGVLLLRTARKPLQNAQRLETTPSQSVDQRIRQAKNFKYNKVRPAPPAVAAQTLSSNIQFILSPAAHYEDRSVMARSISTNLPSAEVDALYSFLLTKSPEDEDQNAQVLKNDVMDALCAMQPPPAQLADLLVQIYHDRSQNDVLRDYAVQHLATFHVGMKSQFEDMQRARSFEITESETILWEALSETDNSIGGTALLGLAKLSQSEPNTDQKPVAEAALKLAGDSRTGELTHLTALQVCAKLQVADALPLALSDAQQGATGPLRISAIGVLGLLGGADQIDFLKALIQGADDRLKLPAQHALNQINQRLGQASQSH